MDSKRKTLTYEQLKKICAQDALVRAIVESRAKEIAARFPLVKR